MSMQSQMQISRLRGVESVESDAWYFEVNKVLNSKTCLCGLVG